MRLKYSTMDEIDGRDPAIMAPVQTANPDNYGGERFDVVLGINLVGQRDWYRGHRVAIEATVPVEQDLNGPQMETAGRLPSAGRKLF